MKIVFSTKNQVAENGAKPCLVWLDRGESNICLGVASKTSYGTWFARLDNRKGGIREFESKSKADLVNCVREYFC
jgi:hypothetical protein